MTVLIAALLTTTPLFGQHADIEFSYEDNVLVLRNGIEGLGDADQIFPGTFPTSGFAANFTENPGFLSEVANGDMLLPGDGIEIEILQTSTGSYLTYFDPVANAFMPTEATISIDDNAGTNTSDLVIGNLEFSGDNPQFIQTASATGEVHSHIDFVLDNVECDPPEDTSGCGAYGFLFRMLSDNMSIEDSQPIWLVFNYGMSPFDFEDFAIPAFAAPQFLVGDANGDGVVNLLDVAPFVEILTLGIFDPVADINLDGEVNLLDVEPFVMLLTGG